MSHTNWVFTLNNYTKEEVELLAKTDKLKYIFYGKETAPETGTPHLQGYFVTTKKVRRASFKKWLPRAHVEAMGGTLADNDKYCSKEEGVETFERGEKPRDRKRNLMDWHEIADYAKRGKFTELLEEYPMAYIRYDRALHRIHQDFQDVPAELDTLDNLWYYGPPGTGKTTKAYRENPGAYIKMANKWWDDYITEDVVIIDDLDHQSSRISHLLKQWTHKVKYRGEYKGGSRMMRPKKIIVTSNYTPEELWPDDPMLAEAVRRRFKFVHFTLKF